MQTTPDWERMLHSDELHTHHRPREPMSEKPPLSPEDIAELLAAMERKFGPGGATMGSARGRPTPPPPDDAMSEQDRYIDARLEAIEGKLDARMEAMQRFQEQAEARMEQSRKETEARNRELFERIEKQSERAEARFHQAEERFSSEVSALNHTMSSRFDEARRHSTHVAIATVAGVIAAVGLSMAVSVAWISDQSAWLRDSVDRIEQRSVPPVPNSESEPASPSPEES